MTTLTITRTCNWSPLQKDKSQKEIECKNEECPFQYGDIDVLGKHFTACHLSYNEDFQLDKGNIITITETIKNPEGK
jgi:hypothetical protein